MTKFLKVFCADHRDGRYFFEVEEMDESTHMITLRNVEVPEDQFTAERAPNMFTRAARGFDERWPNGIHSFVDCLNYLSDRNGYERG